MNNLSFRLNFEVAAALFDEGLAELLAETFRADLQRAVEYRLRTARRTPMWQGMSEATARLLSPLL